MPNSVVRKIDPQVFLDDAMKAFSAALFDIDPLGLNALMNARNFVSDRDSSGIKNL
jgi:hypothetical protein